jgi:hypothetical protein
LRGQLAKIGGVLSGIVVEAFPQAALYFANLFDDIVRGRPFLVAHLYLLNRSRGVTMPGT